MYIVGVFKNVAKMVRCPLCGEEVSWRDKKVAEYACLYVCVRLIPYPEHLLAKHREYLEAAGKVAKPVFYSASVFTFMFITSILAVKLPIVVTLVFGISAASLWILGAFLRRSLLARFKTR